MKLCFVSENGARETYFVDAPCTWMSSDRKMHGHIHNILIDRRRCLGVLDIQSFLAADCDTNHSLVVAKFRERLAVNKHKSHNYHMERLNFTKLKDVEGKEKYCFAVL
jgi:hypothetical protein